MTAETRCLADLYFRDLSRLVQEIDAYPGDEILWRKIPGITNSAGNLVLHLEGNLREYIGRQLGGLDYQRNRPLEFTAGKISKHELLRRAEELRDKIPSVIRSISPEKMDSDYPEAVLGRTLSTRAFLTHLYGHLSWHMGQLDYLRRALTGNGAIELAGL